MAGMEFDNSVNLLLNSSMVLVSDFFMLVKAATRCLGSFLLPNFSRKADLKSAMVVKELFGKLSYQFPALPSTDRAKRVM